MVDIRAMHRRMTSFLGYDSASEIRSDTGALYSEVQESEWRRNNRYKNHINRFRKEEGEVLGINRINFEKGTDKTFMYKSRGNSNSRVID